MAAQKKPAKPKSAESVAAEILRRKKAPMRVSELAKQTAKKAPGLKGKTPEATVSAHIYTAAKRGKTFEIVDRGVVRLRETA